MSWMSRRRWRRMRRYCTTTSSPRGSNPGRPNRRTSPRWFVSPRAMSRPGSPRPRSSSSCAVRQSTVTRPISGAAVEVKLGAKKEGKIVAAEAVLKYQSGAFRGSPVNQGCMCGLAVYDLPNAVVTGYDVLSNRPKVAAYRAPGAPIASFAIESCVDELARELRIDPIKMREINGAKDGTKATHGPTWNNIGYMKTIEAAKTHPQWSVPLGPNQGRGIASGYWHNAGGESSAPCHVNDDGPGTATEGHPDSGRAPRALASV